MEKNELTVIEHFVELRRRLVFIVVFFLLAMIGSFFLAEPLIIYLQQTDEAASLELNAFRLTDPLKIYMQIAFIIACVITSPFVLYQLWAFISPGLYEKEKKITLAYIPVSVFLFLSGISFSYFVLFPFIVRFMKQLGDRMEINQVIGINEYFHFLLQITLPFGLLFQLPVIILFLTRLGIITPDFLSRVRKYAYFILLVIAALITPPDILSHMMVTLPLILLYEVSIWISKLVYRKKMKEEEGLAV
ncbi:twin-arginine translocase subunit TatC [Caldibacillus sp. 210928-DFI.2.22]|uniref:twin-arginine translocase subunit TatC n=1 Tax=unclassified Caldibacillus TaxID=2641266 RepID=UPI001D08AAC3|nr:MULTISPECIES: twin-arginine translocase subunit TatC [unclassified Caldibacillus]MCB7069639.1 twin-arginine translocase subunit TatC [Caldibacillus sp. 210928-DFI.2.22]MCB7073018.1 twin-arginine translocase subunit TatC [Caldibacillus sp. 210928-DFI.2.18]